MYPRRFAAAFLLSCALFAVPGSAHAEGTAADKMCPAEEKNKQEYQPAKPWNKFFTEKRDGKTVTIMNLFGKPCRDVTNEEVVTGHCIRQDRCLATKTSEGKDPATCKETGECPDGATTGTTDPEAPDNGPIEEPKEPKPDNSDGVLPLPDEPKPETDIWKDGTTPFYQPTNSFGEVLKGTGADSWFTKAVETYFGEPQGSFGETSNIGNYYGAESLQGGGLDNGLGGSSGGSLYEQAVNQYTSESSFSDTSVQPSPENTPWYTQAAQWAGEQIGAASDYLAKTYDSVYDSLFGAEGDSLATDATTEPDVEKNYTDPFYDGLEPLQELTPEERAEINEGGIKDREDLADFENPDEARLKAAESRVPVPDQVPTDPQGDFEEENRLDAEAERQALAEWDEPEAKPNSEPVDPALVEKLQRLEQLKADQGNKRVDFEDQYDKAKAADEKLQKMNEEFRERWAPHRQCSGIDGCTNLDNSYDVRDAAEQKEFADMQKAIQEQARITGTEYAKAQDLLDEYKLAEQQINTLTDDREVGDFLRQEEREIDSIEAKFAAEESAFNSRDRAQSMADALKAKMEKDTSQIGNGFGLSKDCWGVCNTVTYTDAFGNERTVPLSEYTRENSELLQALQSDVDKYNARANFFASDDPLAAQTAKTIDEGGYRGYLAEKTLDKMLEEGPRADAVREGQYYSDPDAATREADRRAQLERLTSGGELTQLEQEALRKSTGMTEAELLESERLSRLGNGTVRSINDALRLSGPEDKLTASEAASRLFMSESEVYQQQKDAWGEAALRLGTDAANIALLSTGAAQAVTAVEASLLAGRELAASSIASEINASKSFFAESATGREAFLENQVALREASLARMESDLNKGLNGVTQNQVNAARAELGAYEAKLAEYRGVLTESTGVNEARLATQSSSIGESAIAERAGTAATETAGGELTTAAADAGHSTRALVTANDPIEGAAAISRGVQADRAISQTGVLKTGEGQYLYEVKPSGDVVLSPADGARIGELTQVSAKELNAIADTRGISPIVNEPTVLHDLSGPVTPTERVAVDAYERAARELEAWSVTRTGPSPSSDLALAEKRIADAGLARSIDGSIYRPTTGEVLGRIESVQPGLVNAARPEAVVPQYTKAGNQWFETSNMSKPITNSEIISSLESKLPGNSIPATQIAADVNQAKAIAAAEAREAERFAAQRRAQDRAAQAASERLAERNPLFTPQSDMQPAASRVARAPETQEVKDALARLQKEGDLQALRENGRVLSGPTTQTLRDGLAALKNAGGVPADVKFAKGYLDDAVYRVSPGGALSRVTDPEIITAVKKAANPVIRTTEAESIGRAAQNLANAREAEEALQAQIVAAKNYNGEIMVAQDVREAMRAIAGDLDAIARQSARDATRFAWTADAQLPQTLAEITGSKGLTEAEKILAAPYRAPTSGFARANNVSSDGLAAAREPYRAPQTTFAEAQTAVRERLGGSTPPELIAERATLSEGARPVPSARTVVQDLAPSVDNIPLVEVKPIAGVRVGDPLTLPEAQAVRSFNSALANYTKNYEAGGDLSRAANQLSNAYTELATVGIRQRASDGALARENGEVVAVRVSPPMAAQAAYAVVVAVDSQVREFATGQTDETFSFTTPDLRVLSSDFGVQPPINTDEAITLQKVNDILAYTRSRDSFDYAMENSGLRVRPEDGFIVREENGEVIARPAGGSGLPGSLPDSYVPAGPVPPLPVKLVLDETIPQEDGSIKEIYKAKNYQDRTIAAMSVTINGATAFINNIVANRPGQVGIEAYKNTLGPSTMRSLLRQFREQHPEIVAIGGQRMSGARFAGDWDPAQAGEEIEVSLPVMPVVPMEPVPVRAAGNGPAAIALGIALSVASPLPISAISDAIGGPNNAFSTAVQAAQVPTARDVERHAKAIADIGKVQSGIASWYSTGSNGGTNPSDLTASGAWHTNNGYTVAMLGAGPKYAWGTRLLVRNAQEFLKNGSKNPHFGKEVEVVVTNTGSQSNRSLDLSPKAFEAITDIQDGTTLVEFSVVSIPDIADAMYRKGRTDLTGGSPMPKGTFNQKVASLKENPKLALAEPRGGIQGTTLVAGSKPTNPVASVLDTIGKSVGEVLKASKTSNDKAVDLVTTIQKANPNISSLELAARLELSGLKNTDTYASMRERAAHELIGKQGSDGAVSDTQLANADVKIAQRVQMIKNPAPAPKLAIAEAAKQSGRPQIRGIDNLVYLAPLSDPSIANKRSFIVLHQTEGPSALSLAKKQAANPNRVGTTLWVEPDGTVYWAAPETSNPSHVRGNRDDNKYISNKETLNKINNANSIGIEFAGNYPDPAKPLTEAQMRVGKVLINFLQERYNIPAQNIFAHGWIDYKDGRYVEGGQLATAARELAYVPRVGSALASADVPATAPVPDLTDPWAFSTTGVTPAMPAPETKLVSPDIAPEFTRPASINGVAYVPETPTTVAPDIEAMIAVNVQYAPAESPSWKLPTPQVTLTATTPLEPVPVPDVTRGTDLAPAQEPVPTPDQIAAIPVPDQVQPNFNDVRQPTTPLAANPTPTVTRGPDTEQPIPREVITAAKLDPIKSDGYTVVLAQPTMVRQALFGNFGTYSYIPPSLREKLANAEHDDDFIVFTRAELDSIRWDKMDKNGYQVMSAILSGGGAYTPPLPNSGREAGPQIFPDGLETIQTVVIVKPESPGAVPEEVIAPPLEAGAVPFSPTTIEELTPPAGDLPVEVPALTQTDDIDALQKRYADAQSAADAAAAKLADTKTRFDANNAKLKTIAENVQVTVAAQSNLGTVQSGLNMLRSLNALPNENQLAQLKSSVSAAKRLATNVSELEDPDLSKKINDFSALLNALRIKENQTAANKNATVSRGNILTKQTRSLIAETEKETAAIGNKATIEAENKKLASEFAGLKKEIATANATRDAAKKALAEAGERPQTRGVETPKVAETPAPTTQTSAPEPALSEPLPASRPPAEEVKVTTESNPADQSRIQKAFNRTYDAVTRLDAKLLTDTAIKSYKKIAQAVGLGPKESSVVPVLKSAPLDATPVAGSDLSYVCSTAATCTEKTSDAVMIRTEPGRSYAKVLADDKPIAARQAEAAFTNTDVTFLARAAGGFVTAGNTGKAVSQDLTYSNGKLIGSKTVNPNASQGLVIANERGDAIIVDKRDIPVSEFAKLGANTGANAPTDRIDVAKDIAKLDTIMRDNSLSAFTNLLLIKDGVIQNVQSSIAEPRRLLLQMPDGSIAILNSTKDQTMLGITQIAKALGAKHAVNLDTGSYNEGRVAVQSGEAPYLGNSAKSEALTNIYLGVRTTPQEVPTIQPSDRTEAPIAGETLPAGRPAPVPNTPTPNNGPIESFGVTGRRAQPDVGSPQTTPANDNTPPVPTAPLRTADVIAFTQPRVAPLPVFVAERWPTVTPEPQLILEGEILPPAPVSVSYSQVGEPKPFLDLEPIRHVYSGMDRLGKPAVVLDTVVAGDVALVSMRNIGPALPSIDEVESLVRQLAARHPNVNTIVPRPIAEERGLVVARPSVNVLPALENILVTGPTLYVNSSGTVWPTLSGASADADLRRILTEARADSSIEDGIRDIVATIQPGESLADVASRPSVPGVQAPRLASDQLLTDAIKGFAAERVQTSQVRPSVPQQPKPDLTRSAAPSRSFRQVAGDIWSDTKLAGRISRGVILPAGSADSSYSGSAAKNVTVNAMNMLGAYMLTGPYTVITWPMANVGWRYVFNKDYRADVNGVFSRVATAVQNARAERAIARANQEALNPNMGPSLSSAPQSVPVATPPATDRALEDGIREIVKDIKPATRAPEKTTVPEVRTNVPLPTEGGAEGTPPETRADRLTETVGEFAADRPEVEKWGPYSNIRNWFANLGKGGSGGGNGGGNGGGSGGGDLVPAGSSSGSGSIRDGFASLLRLVPGLSTLIANAPQPDEKQKPSVEVPLESPLAAGTPAPSKTETKPTETKPADTKTDPKKEPTTPKPDTKPGTEQPKPQPDAKPAPQTTTPPSGTTPTSQSAPTGGTNAKGGGGAMSGLMSFLSGLLKGLTGSQPQQQPQPAAQPNGGVVVAIYAQPNPAAPTEQVLIRWTSTNASTCNVFNASSTKVATGAPGAMFNAPATSSAKYTAYCSNPMGQYASATVQIMLK